MRPALAIVASASGFYLSNGVMMVFLAVLLAEHGMNPGEIGTTLGLSYITRVIAAPIWGLLADRLGRVRLVLALCCVCAAVPMLLILRVHGFWPALILILLTSAGSSAISPLFDVISWRSAEHYGFSFGPVRAAGSACFVIGNLVGGVVEQSQGGDSVAWMMAACYGITLLFLPGVPKLSLPRPDKRAKMIAPLLAIASFRRLLLISALVQGAHAAYYGLSTLYWRGAGVPDRIIGLLWGEGVVAEIVVMVLLRRIVGQIDPYRLMRIGAVGAILRWIGMGLTTDPILLAVMQPLHAMSFTLSYLACLRLIAETTPRHLAATAQNLYAALGLSAPTGVMIAAVSWLYPSWGGEVFFLMAAMVALALPLLWHRDTAL